MAHAGGRPTTYKAEYCDRIRELAKAGKLPNSWAIACGVSLQTLHNWKESNPEFFDAFNDAKSFCLEWWQNHAQVCAISEPGRYNFNAVKFMLSAAFGMSEKSEQTTTLQGPDGGPVQHSIGVKFVD